VAIANIQLGDPPTLSLLGASSQMYTIQAATNLSSALWETLGSNTVGSDGVSRFPDLKAGNSATRFYRSITP
jgi:hypothetical protein